MLGASTASIRWAALTRREREVAALVADGLTNRQIAERLFISERTADSHLEQIRQKLGVNTRSQIATWFVTRSREPQPGKPAMEVRWPPQPTVLLGRDRELAELREMVLRPDVRLLSLTGPPGTGKTRLASRVALDLIGDYSDGVRFVDLSAITDPGLVLSAIGQVLGARPSLDSLIAALQTKRSLLLLDNFEQVLPAAGQIADLLASCADLKALVTSRECLHLLRWEREYPVQPLELPDLLHLPAVEALATIPSVALFVERAQARNPRFLLTVENAFAVAKICTRLDGLPLAIELAAAATKLLAPDVILGHLEDRRGLATRGGADFPKRHQTLSDAIGASYDLLSVDEQTMLRRMGVFVGGFNLESLEAVCTGEVIPLDRTTMILGKLVDKSLVQIDNSGGRYRLLDTIREYALERLMKTGEAQAIIARRDQFLVKLAERAVDAFDKSSEGEWRDRLLLEIDNFRATAARAIADRDLETGLRLGVALARFWRYRGFLDEGQHLLAALVALAVETGEIEKFPAALRELGILTGEQRDYSAARSLLDQYLAIARPTGDKSGVARALYYLAKWARGDDLKASREWIEESLQLARECGDQTRVTFCLQDLGLIAHLQNDETSATSLLDEGVKMARRQGGIPLAIGALFQGRVALDRGDYAKAAAGWSESLKVSMAVGDLWLVPVLLESLAKLAVIEGKPLIALRLAGASEALSEVIGAGHDPLWYPDFEQQINAAVGGDATRHAEWLTGRFLAIDDAVRLAYSLTDGTAAHG